ncbi:MAG: hypothetical protein HY553_14625 [Elusimicrobia bacterium]|nr:hypothetical protein [Elusimicrobiota bacterium]
MRLVTGDRERLLESVEEGLAPWADAARFDGAADEAAVRRHLGAQGYALVIMVASEAEFAYAGQAIRLLIADATIRRDVALRNALRNRFAAEGWSGEWEPRCWERLRRQLGAEIGGGLWEQARNSAVSRLVLTERLRGTVRTRLGAHFDRFLTARIGDHSVRTWRRFAPARPLLHQGTGRQSDFELLCWDLWDLALYGTLRPLFLATRGDPFLGDWLEAGAAGAGFAFLWRRIAVVLAMPAVSVDARGRLHNPAGPSVCWPEGGGRHFHWHGIRVPEKVILRPDSLTRLDIASETNSEVSRATAERIGWERYLELAEARRIDEWLDERTRCRYELYAVQGEGRAQMVRLLKMESPQLKDGVKPFYVEPVPPGLNTCRAARKWQFRKPDGTWPSVRECNDDPALEFHDEA